MARRRKRKRAKGGLLLLIALALLVAGFLARRMLVPAASRYFPRASGSELRIAPPPVHPQAHESPGKKVAQDRPEAQPPPAKPAQPPPDRGGLEHLTDQDRQALDDLLRSKVR